MSDSPPALTCHLAPPPSYPPPPPSPSTTDARLRRRRRPARCDARSPIGSWAGCPPQRPAWRSASRRRPTRILFVSPACSAASALVVYAAMWLFVPDDYGRVLIQGGAADRKEATWAAIFTALASTTLSWWTFDGTGFLIPLLYRPRRVVPRPSRPETGTASRPETAASRPETGRPVGPTGPGDTGRSLPSLPFPPVPPSSPMAPTATTTPVPPAPAWPDTVADQGRYDSPPLPDAADAGARLSSIPPGGGRPVAIAPVPPP